MNYQHKKLAGGNWQKLSLVKQMANIGSEVERAIRWKNKNKPDIAGRALERALELFDLTIADKKNVKRLKEIARSRELLVDFFIGGNSYKCTDEFWQKYFYSFNYASRLQV